MERTRASVTTPVLLALLAAAPSSVDAATAELQLQQEAVWEGQPVILQLSITNPPRSLGPPVLPPPAGLGVEGPAGPARQVFSVNGRQSTQLSYNWRLTPPKGRFGKFVIGPVSIQRAGGPPLRSNTVELKVFRKPKPGILFEASVTPAGGPVAMPFRLVYTVSYTGDPADSEDDFFSIGTGRSSPLGLSSLDVPALKLTGVRVTPIRVLPQQRATRIQLSDGSTVLVQRSFRQLPDGRGYRTLVFGVEIVPFAPGDVEIPAASVSMKLKTGRTRVVRDFVFQRRVPELAEYRATARAVRYRVQPLPEEGRPPGFTGAVGSYRIEVSASPLEVDAHAPITLVIRVSGEGLIEELKPPAWAEMDVLTRDFDVSRDADSGKVEGKTKVFQQRIQPRSEKITQIPPIPFPYFDPRAGKYQVALSKPIPIKVRAVRTVGADESIPSARSLSRERSSAKQGPAIASIREELGVGANFESLGTARAALDPREQIVSAAFLAALFGPPLLYALFLLLGRVARRSPEEKKRRSALAAARAHLARAPSDFDGLGEAFQAYLRARLGLPAGEVTPGDLAPRLRERGAPQDLVARVSGVLEELLAARFGGATAVPESLLRRVRDAVREVDRCKL